MASNPSANVRALVSRERAGNAVERALSLYVGRGRRWSVKELANATGVPDRVIECAKADPEGQDFRPLTIADFLSIASFIGPDFTTTVTAIIGQGAYYLPDGDGDLAALNRDCAELNFEHSQATDENSDGGTTVTPFERKRLRAIAIRMQPRVATVAAA